MLQKRDPRFALGAAVAEAENVDVTGAATSSFPLFGAASAEKLPLVVSIHDIAPPTQAACEQILAELARHGVGNCSLLVVPDYHHTGTAMANRPFVRWLHELEAAGHEIVIHGYFHERASRTGETLRDRVVTGFYTESEGEFYDLDYAEALRRIVLARDEFTAAGLRPRGFIAPAWLLGEAGERAAVDAEMEYTTRLTSVIDLRTTRHFQARSLVYSVRSTWRRGMSLAWNGTLAYLQQNAALIRLAIHPVDLKHQNIWRHILHLSDRFAATRLPTTYCDWIGEQRRDP